MTAKQHRAEPAGKLPRREREVLEAVIALGNRAAVDQIRTRLTEPPSYSAVRAMCTRLEGKGHLKHESDGTRYVYSATTPTSLARRAALQRYLQTFFGGSLPRMMTALVRDERWSMGELEELKGEIERVRKQRGER